MNAIAENAKIVWHNAWEMVAHIAGSLPYLLVMVYLAWVHLRAIRREPRKATPALITAFVIVMLTAGTAVWNQPPWRLMVSVETNALVKDIVLVVQSLLFTLFVDQLRERRWRFPLFWISGAAVAVAHSTYWYLEGLLIQTRIIHVPWTLTAYVVTAYVYSLSGFEQARDESTRVATKWRLRTMSVAMAAGVAYAIGKGVMGSLPESEVIQYVTVWANRLALTVATVGMLLGMTMPGWYRRLGIQLHLVRHAAQHADELIGLVGVLADREVALADEKRSRLRNLACWLAAELDYPATSQRIVQHLAVVTPVGSDHGGRPVPNWSRVEEEELDLADTVSIWSAIFRTVSCWQGDVRYEEAREAVIVKAARAYLEGRSVKEIEELTSPRIAAKLQRLLEKDDRYARDTNAQVPAG